MSNMSDDVGDDVAYDIERMSAEQLLYAYGPHVMSGEYHPCGSECCGNAVRDEILRRMTADR